VRAGIPRTLDSLCDHILNHGGDTEVTAAMMSDALRDFLGPSATAAEAWLTRIEHSRKGVTTIVLPALPDPPPREVLPTSEVDTSESPATEVPDPEAGAAAQETQD